MASQHLLFGSRGLSSTDFKILFAVPVSLTQQNTASAASTIHITTALFSLFVQQAGSKPKIF